MKSLSQVAQAHRRAVMTPVDDAAEFERAVLYARMARGWRERKKAAPHHFTPGWLETMARRAERNVREIALQSEILLARRADDGQDHRVMLDVMLGSSL